MGQQQTHAAQQITSIIRSHRQREPKSVGGIVNPSALAVFRLMTSYATELSTVSADQCPLCLL
jgi:hypothetical protein